MGRPTIAGKPPSCQDVSRIIRATPGDHLTPSSTGSAEGELFKRMQKCGYLDTSSRRLAPEERLQAQYKQDGLVLFLGAGASAESDIPTWPKLIDKIVKTVRQQGSQALLDAGIPLTAQLDVAKHNLQDQFTMALYDALYEEVPAYVRDIPKSDLEKLTAKTWKETWEPSITWFEKNATLKAVGDLIGNKERDCRISRLFRMDNRGRSFRLNPLIHAILTTNADNLLQIYAMALNGGARILNTVNRPSVADHPGLLSVYHLHGFLDVREKPASDREGLNELVFRESDYVETVANVNGFANYTAQSFLQRFNVLFIGTSLIDINLRRWLYNSFQERVKHRARALQEMHHDQYTSCAADTEARAASVRYFCLRYAPEVPESLKEHVEISLREFGVEVIWYGDGEGGTKHGGLPPTLRRIRGK